MKISAIVHTLNEEKNIEACLKCLVWVDEIIIIDMYSDDKTVEICKRYTTNIFSFERSGGIVEPAREFALTKATGDWILIVDADERIPVTLANKLKEIAASGNYDHVEIPFKNYLFGKWMNYSGMFPDYHPRFFKKGMVTSSNKVHGKFKTSGNCLKLDQSNEGLCVTHFGYKTINQYVEKLNRYTDAEVEKFIIQNKKFTKMKMVMAGFYEFRRRYFSKKGYKDGVHGIIVSLLRGFYHILIYAKYWEYMESKNGTAEDKYKKIEDTLINEHKKTS